MKHIIMSFVMILLSTSNYVVAKDYFSVEKPVTSTVQVVVFTGLNQLWVKVYDDKKYKQITKKSPFKYKKPKHSSFLIELYGIQHRKMSDVDDKENDKQYIAMVKISNMLKGEVASIKCFGRNKKIGIPVCQLITEGDDLGLNIISAGYSPFRTNKIKNKKLKAAYDKIFEESKTRGNGIWEPYYGLFMQDDFEK